MLMGERVQRLRPSKMNVLRKVEEEMFWQRVVAAGIEAPTPRCYSPGCILRAVHGRGVGVSNGMSAKKTICSAEILQDSAL